tara:strand:- start:247 stop:510 length:264 start_codon:yes stop_codon:yes gene_type:complete
VTSAEVQNKERVIYCSLTYGDIMNDFKHEIRAILAETTEDIFKVVWKDAWADYQFDYHQRNIDELAIQAQLTIDELKQDIHFKEEVL